MLFRIRGPPRIDIRTAVVFLIFVDDIVDEMECIVNLFADDTSVQQKIIDITSFDAVNRDLSRLENNGKSYLMQLKQNT